MRIKLFIIIIAVFLNLFPVSVMGDIAIVVHPDNKVEALSRDQVVDLFMGRHVAFPDGAFALPFDLPVDTEIRKQFYYAITGKTIPQINAYWAKLIFSGRATPPRLVKSMEELLTAISNNKNSIAYINTAYVNKKIKVVLKINTEGM